MFWIHTAMKRLIFSMAVLVLLPAMAFADMQLGKLPAPPPSPKLRVLVIPVSARSPMQGWAISHEQFKRSSLRGITNFLSDTGIYEIVPEADIRTVLGTQAIEDWRWLKDDLALARSAGKALYADYVIVNIRSSVTGHDHESKLVCLNLETGKKYANSFFVTILPKQKSPKETALQNRQLFQRYYREMFRELRSDILATAVRKERKIPAEKMKQPEAEKLPPAAVDPPAEAVAPPPAKPQVSPVQSSRVAEKLKEFESAMAADHPDEAKAGKSRLVVYDFASPERLSVVALILADALREELLTLGRFILVNRESMAPVMNELKLQQSGLVDESQLVRLGNWLAANETISGRLAFLGNSYILQAKRIDVKTLETLGLGSLKCASGHEEEMLSEIAALARKLVEVKK